MSAIRNHRKQYTLALVAKRKELARHRARIGKNSAVRILDQQGVMKGSRAIAIVVGPKRYAYQLIDN